MTTRKRLIFDTNTLISAATYAYSLPAKVFRQGKQEHEVFISSETIEELEEVIYRKKFDRYFADKEERRGEFIDEYLDAATLAPVTQISTDCRDFKDNKFLSLALSVGADIIVSGDDDLLVLNPYQGIRIMTVRQYADENGIGSYDKREPN